MSTSSIEDKLADTNALIADVRLKLKTDMVNLNAATKLHINLKTDEVLQKIDETCAEAPGVRRGLEERGCNQEDLQVHCAFNQPAHGEIAVTGKTLFLREGTRKIDTGLIYDVPVRSFR